MATLTEVLTSPEFAKGSNAKRDEIFQQWKQTDLEPGLAQFETETERADIRRKVENFYQQANPTFESENLGDLGTNLSASVDQAQGLVAEVGSQIARGLEDLTGRTRPGDVRIPGLDPVADLEAETGLDTSLSATLRGERIEQFAEADEVRKDLSNFSKDKQLELKERQDAVDSDAAKAAATVSFFLGTPENMDVLDLLTYSPLGSFVSEGAPGQLMQLSASSAATTAVGIGATVAGGLAGGPVGATAAASAVGGALTGAEASAGAFDKARDELKKQGLSDTEATEQAAKVSKTAFAIGTAAGAVLEPLGEALPVIRSFARKANTPDTPTRTETIETPTSTTTIETGPQAADPGLFDTLATGTGLGLVTGVVSEGIQGASTQVAENIAVDEVVPTDTFDGAITAGVTEALAAGPTIAATEVAVQAHDKALEIMQGRAERSQAEEILDGYDVQDQTTPEVIPDTPDLGRPDIGDVTGGSDSTGGGVSTPPAAGTDGDTTTTEPPVTTGDTGGATQTPGAVSVPVESTGAGTPDTTSAERTPESTGVQSGSGAAANPDAGTDVTGDGDSGTATTASSGADGQQVGDSTPTDLDREAPVPGTLVSYGGLEEEMRRVSPTAPTVEEVVAVLPEEDVQAYADAIELGEDVDTATRTLLSAYDTSVSEAQPQSQETDRPNLTEINAAESTNPNQAEWDSHNTGVEFSQLDPELATQWSDAIEDGYADATRANQIATIQRRNNTATRNTPAQAAPLAVPQDMVARMRTDTTTDATTAYESDGGALPIVVDDGATDAGSLPTSFADTPLNLEGDAGLLNAAIKQNGEDGTYIIADVAAGTAHIMTKAGSLQRSVPFTQNITQAPAHELSGPNGVVPYQRLSVKPKGARRKSKDGVSQFPGMALPTDLVADINPRGAKFSGRVYVLPADETRSTPEPDGRTQQVDLDDLDAMASVVPDTEEEIQVGMFVKPIPSEVAAIIPEYGTGDPMQAVELVDALLKHPDTSSVLDGFYTEVLNKIRPFLEDSVISQEARPFGREGVAGAYHQDTDSTRLDPNTGMSYHVITHELVHAATVHALFYRRSAATDPIRRQIEHAYEMVRSTPDLQAYGLTNTREFVAEIFTNPNFRNEVNRLADARTSIDVNGTDQHPTLWDMVQEEISKGLFRIEPNFTADNMVDWTEMLFSTSRELQETEHTELGTKGRTKADIINSRTPGNVSEGFSRASTIRKAYAARNKLREWVVDDVTPFLTFLNLRTNVQRVTKDHDGFKSWLLLKLAPQQKKTRMAQFMQYHDRRIKVSSKQLFEKYGRASGYTAAEIFEFAAHYATWAHIPNATRVARDQLVEARATAEEQMQAAEAELAPGEELAPDVEIRLNERINTADLRLRLFDEAQENNGRYGPNWPGPEEAGTPLSELDGMGYTIMGGSTAKNAVRELEQIAEKIAGPDGDVQQAQADLEAIRWQYVAAHRDIWRKLIAAGEVTQAEADRHRDSGLDVDYIPFTGGDKDTAEDEQTPFGGRASSISAPVEQHRNGRLSTPESAYHSMVRKADNMASRLATRDFKHQLLADIISGQIPPSLAGWYRVTPGNLGRSRAPKGIKSIYLRTEEGTYEMWINDPKVMSALRNISGERFDNGILRAIGTTNRFAMRLFTFLDPMFAPTNAIRDVGERIVNIGTRDFGTVGADGEPLNVNVLALRTQIIRNAGDLGLITDSWNIYRKRGFGSKPIANEVATSRMGKYLLEAEEMGAITIEMDSLEELFAAGPGTKEDQLMLRRMTQFNGELMKASLEADGKKLTAKQIKALARQTQGKTRLSADALYASITLYQRMFDIRATVATYAALRDANVPKDVAAFRTLDLMNYTQRGGSAFSRGATALVPFFRPAVNGAANTARTLGTTRGVVEFAGMAGIGAALYGMLSAIAGDNDDDPTFQYNRLDAVPALTTRGSVPILIGDTVYKWPVPYGSARLGWVSGVQMIKGMREGPLYTKEDGFSEVVKATIDEMIPKQTEINPFESATSAAKFLMLQVTPEIARGGVATLMNINEWGGTVDYATRSDIPKYAQGYFRTAEVWKDAAYHLNQVSDKFNFTPQQVRGYVSSVFQGVLTGFTEGASVGDREAKGLPVSARNELGYLNFFGLSKLYARVPPPEERTARQLQQHYTRERLDPRYGSYVLEKPARKLTKSGRPSRAKRNPKGVWVWNDANLAEDGKLYLKEIAPLLDQFNKDLRKIAADTQKPYKEAMRKEHDARRAGFGDSEDLAWSVGQEILNRPENKKIFREGYVKQREVFRRFINLTKQIKDGQ